jgi:hypothetical protein
MAEGIQLLRKKAEAAVEDMPDGEMKLRAFQVILGHLLEVNAGAQPRPEPRAQTNASAKARSAKPLQSVPRTSGDRILFLHAEGFFGSQRSLSDVQGELRKNGWHYPVTALSGPLQKLVQRRLFRRERVTDGNRTIWKYANY